MMPGPWDKATLFWENATVSATGASANSFRVGEGAECRIELAVTGQGSGTSPTLDVRIEDSADGSSWASTGVTFAQISGTSTVANARQQRELKARKGRGYARLGHWSGRITDAATTDP
jgi:hypothetical protein